MAGKQKAAAPTLDAEALKNITQRPTRTRA